METKKNEKKLVIKETEKKTVNKDNKNVKPISKKVSKTPLSKEDDLREKLAKASGKSVDEVKAKSNAKSNNVASDYDKVMARNKGPARRCRNSAGQPGLLRAGWWKNHHRESGHRNGGPAQGDARSGRQSAHEPGRALPANGQRRDHGVPAPRRR